MARLQGEPEKDPEPLVAKPTVPAGGVGVPGEVSLTEAAQVEV